MSQERQLPDDLAIMWQDRTLTPSPLGDEPIAPLFLAIEAVARRRIACLVAGPGQDATAAAATCEALGSGDRLLHLMREADGLVQRQVQYGRVLGLGLWVDEAVAMGALTAQEARAWDWTEIITPMLEGA